MRLLHNLFCRDPDAQFVFAHRSPIYRGLAWGDTEIGFHAPAVYRLLGLAGREVPTGDATRPVGA